MSGASHKKTDSIAELQELAKIDDGGDTFMEVLLAGIKAGIFYGPGSALISNSYSDPKCYLELTDTELNTDFYTVLNFTRRGSYAAILAANYFQVFGDLIPNSAHTRSVGRIDTPWQIIYSGRLYSRLGLFTSGVDIININFDSDVYVAGKPISIVGGPEGLKQIFAVNREGGIELSHPLGGDTISLSPQTDGTIEADQQWKFTGEWMQVPKVNTAGENTMTSGWGANESGRIWFNTDLGQFRGWNGTEVVAL